MDSPIIVGKASEFGEPIDLDRPFPGFPFDDEGFGRRSDIRSHLNDLATRHPEFADHLLGPPWSDIPFHNSFRNRNRGSGNSGSNSNYQGYSDEDARSQASGSSAASGASGVSSHGEPEGNQQDREQGTRRSQIPQYGLRNTVDIGQHHHNMENLDKGNRGQRSMSAPPENRQSFSQQQPQQPQGQRYVSRIDITPQHNQSPPQQKPQPQQQQQQKPQQQQGNVRHIPIFVEGRDEPVVPRSFDEPHFKREPSPTQFHTPPHFQRPSPFGQSSFGRTQWSPHFQEPFYPPSSSFEHSPRRQQPAHSFQQPRQQQYAEKQPQQHYEQPKPQQKPQPQQPQPQEPPQQDPPKAKPALPKDPLERVALVQQEVDSLAEQVKQYSGNSKTDKEYIYLDEMLTRELIKLDDIETEGRENVRQTRRNAIKCIQATISLLESKASQPKSPELAERQGNEASSSVQVTGQSESMDVDQKTEEQPQNKEPIPLPPCPSSPTKKPEEASEASAETTTANQQQHAARSSSEPMDTAPAEKPEATPMEVQQSPKPADVEEKAEEASEEKRAEEKEPGSDEAAAEKKEVNEKPEAASTENKSENLAPEEGKEAESQQPSEEQQKPAEEKMAVDGEVKKSPKTTKKARKSKKQVPVSDKPIPLPPPESTEASAK
ncbi:BAG domain-containing protein starvin isoform X2 [Andrena cerasifolii]|uniref:BAG domain-containing protein starvin isoform X2 n=1 Tax=Andrena cerasifolii TaxID=2819439 RepID=UPI00403798BC